MTRQTLKQSRSTIAEAEHLLAKCSWKIPDGFYAESTAVSVFIDPMPGQTNGLYHTPLTLFPLTGQVEALQGATISLANAPTEGTIYYGRLDKRGQILFHDLRPGTYHCLTINEPDIESDLQPNLAVLPPLTAKQPIEVLNNELYRFINADNSLQIILRQEGGNYILSLQAKDEIWQNRLIGFSWTPLFSTEQMLLSAQSQLLLAVLTKDEAENGFRADVNVGQIAPAFALRLSERPWGWEWLGAEAEDVLRHSIASAANEKSRQAWQVATDEPTLPAAAKTMISQALHDLNTNPVYIWWRQVEAAGEQISRFIKALQVHIHSEMASFTGLPSAFNTAQPAPAVTRSQRPDDDKPDPVKIVPLSTPGETFSLHLIVGPVSGRQTTFSIKVMDNLLQQPLSRVRVSILNDQKQLLEGDMTREDGIVTFNTIEPGTYFVNVWYRDEKLELPITFTADE